MKKIIAFVAALMLFAGAAGAIDKNIKQYTAETNPTSDDLLVIDNNPAGVTTTNSVTIGNAVTKAHGLSDGFLQIESGVLGSKTAANMRTALDIVNTIRSENATVWAAAPTGGDLVTGYPYLANNDDWDPCNIAGTTDYWAFYNGSSWICPQDLAGNIYIDEISEDIPIADGDGTGSLKNSFDFSELRTGSIPGDEDFTYAIVTNTHDNNFSAKQTFQNGFAATWTSNKPWKSVTVLPGAFSTDGTNCGVLAAVVVNSGPKVPYVECADAAGTMEFTIATMPENWDGGELYVELSVYSAQATPAGTIEFDISVQARGLDESINSTWVTADGQIYFEDAETTATTVDTQYDFFKSRNKTAMAAAGAGGDALFVKLARDNADGTHDTSTQAIRVIGAKVFYQIDNNSEKD
jgi:hypothetical protein